MGEWPVAMQTHAAVPAPAHASPPSSPPRPSPLAFAPTPAALRASLPPPRPLPPTHHHPALEGPSILPLPPPRHMPLHAPQVGTIRSSAADDDGTPPPCSHSRARGLCQHACMAVARVLHAGCQWGPSHTATAWPPSEHAPLGSPPCLHVTGPACGRRPGPANNANLLVPHVQPTRRLRPHRPQRRTWARPPSRCWLLQRPPPRRAIKIKALHGATSYA